MGNKRQFQSLHIISIANLSLFPFLYTEKLKTWFHWICNLVLHRDNSVLNMVEVNIPYKLQLTLYSFKITDGWVQLLPPCARIGNYTTYLIHREKYLGNFKVKCFICHLQTDRFKSFFILTENFQICTTWATLSAFCPLTPPFDISV